MKLTPLATLLSGFLSWQKSNINFNRITQAFDNTLSRDGSSPNFMSAPIDMNSNRLLNVGKPQTNTDGLRLQDLIDASTTPGLVITGGGVSGSYQPLDSTLTTLSAKPTTTFGIALLNTASASTLLAATGVPTLVGAANKYLTNDGTSMSWATVSGVGSGSAVDVNDYLQVGDTNYDGAFSRAFAAHNKVYVPTKPTLVGATTYVITATLNINSGMVLVGDGSDASTITMSTVNAPVILLGASNAGFAVRGLTVTHSGTATAGGDGIAQAQGTNDWINDGAIVDVVASRNYNGFNLGKAFYAIIVFCTAGFNVNTGFKFTTTGNSTVPSTAGGPLQWYLLDCLSGSNGFDGYSYNVTGTAFGGAGVGSSVGTIENCKTYHNGHHGVAYYGTSTHPLNSARVSGGFYGEDLGICIYLDTFARDHVITPDFIELAGNYGINITANNADTTIQVKQCGGCFWDGIHTLGHNTIITGGNFVNNGVAGTGVENFSGIYVAGGSATITGVTSGNFGSTIQQYGIRVVGDDVSITGCRLPISSTFAAGSGSVSGASLSSTQTGNVLGAIYWATGPTNSIVSGCLPKAVNSGAIFTGGTVTGNLIVTGDVTTGTLHSGTSSFTGGINVPSGGMTFTGGVAGNGITVDNVFARVSAGVGTAATGVAGRLDTTNLVMSGALTGATAITSSGTITGNFGTFSSTVSAATLTSSGAVSGTTITSSSDLIANGQFHANGPSAFTSGGVNITSGGMTFTAGVGGNGLTVDNVQARVSAGIGSGGALTGVDGQLKVGAAIGVNIAPHGSGTIDVANGLLNNGSVYTFP